MLAFGPCVVHGGVFGFDPDLVPTVLIDPETNRPPDVGPDSLPCEPAPGSAERAVGRPLCPACARALNRELQGRGELPRFDETDTAAPRRAGQG